MFKTYVSEMDMNNIITNGFISNGNYEGLEPTFHVKCDGYVLLQLMHLMYRFPSDV